MKRANSINQLPTAHSHSYQATSDEKANIM